MPSRDSDRGYGTSGNTAFASEPVSSKLALLETVAIPHDLKNLLLHDNKDAADSLGMLLKTMGHDSCAAYDGLEAVAMVTAFKPNVVLLDIGLPKLNGYDACRRIRQQAGNEAIVIIALTGWSQEEDNCRSKEAGFNFHMVKPLGPAALEKLLAGLLMVPS